LEREGKLPAEATPTEPDTVAGASAVSLPHVTRRVVVGGLAATTTAAWTGSSLPELKDLGTTILKWPVDATIPDVCTENLIRVDDVMESPKLAE
jgi:hypothetical protein